MSILARAGGNGTGRDGAGRATASGPAIDASCENIIYSQFVKAKNIDGKITMYQRRLNTLRNQPLLGVKPFRVKNLCNRTVNVLAEINRRCAYQLSSVANDGNYQNGLLESCL